MQLSALPIDAMLSHKLKVHRLDVNAGRFLVRKKREESSVHISAALAQALGLWRYGRCAEHAAVPEDRVDNPVLGGIHAMVSG
jgi:hypothetical protein